jgi:Zn-finger nucleic acid-binding protein
MMKLQPMMCPRCGKPLHLEKHPLGCLWRCTECSGVAANLAVLHRRLAETVVRDFWRRAGRAGVPSNRRCPSCSKPLREFVAVHEKQSLRLDLCRPCQLMWFDRGEMEVFPKSARPQPSEIATPSGIEFGDSTTDENANKFAYYVEVGLQVILVLLRLFR